MSIGELKLVKSFPNAITLLLLTTHLHVAQISKPALAFPMTSQTPEASIGSATMLADGTLVLTLRAVDPASNAVGDSQLIYAPANPRYPYILEHLGPVQPGQTVMVKPFPVEYSLEIGKPAPAVMALFHAEMASRKIDLSIYNIKYFQSGENIRIAIFYKHRSPSQRGSDPVHKEFEVEISPSQMRVTRVIHAR